MFFLNNSNMLICVWIILHMILIHVSVCVCRAKPTPVALLINNDGLKEQFIHTLHLHTHPNVGCHSWSCQCDIRWVCWCCFISTLSKIQTRSIHVLLTDSAAQEVPWNITIFFYLEHEFLSQTRTQKSSADVSSQSLRQRCVLTPFFLYTTWYLDHTKRHWHLWLNKCKTEQFNIVVYRLITKSIHLHLQPLADWPVMRLRPVFLHCFFIYIIHTPFCIIQ